MSDFKKHEATSISISLPRNTRNKCRFKHSSIQGSFVVRTTCDVDHMISDVTELVQSLAEQEKVQVVLFDSSGAH